MSSIDDATWPPLVAELLAERFLERAGVEHHPVVGRDQSQLGGDPDSLELVGKAGDGEEDGHRAFGEGNAEDFVLAPDQQVRQLRTLASLVQRRWHCVCLVPEDELQEGTAEFGGERSGRRLGHRAAAENR